MTDETSAKPAKGKSKATKAKPTKINKRLAVLEMMRAEGGTTVAAIAKKFVISTGAARSLIGDNKAKGIAVTSIRVEGQADLAYTAAKE
ncbi:hypothetical protein ACVDG8_002425 [Mesorhizobium sp. ORM8.1]